MVGVAGKSKGCNSCRMRKIKCDQEKPGCGQCLRRGRHCPGYRRETVFLNQGNNAVVKKSSSNSSSVSPRDETQASADDQRTGRATRSQPPRQTKAAMQNLARLTDQYMFKNLFAGEFLRIYLPSANNRPQVPLTWLQLVLNTPTDSLVLDHAMAAVSLSVVGRATNNTTIAVESSRKYGQALLELQRALWQESLMYRDDTLAACNALVLYELLESTDSNLQGWVSHAQGLGRLIEARGPESYDSPLAHMVYTSFRQVAMIHDLRSRRASAFTHPKWQTGPWKNYNKGPEQRLYDIGADLAAILASADRLKTTQGNIALAPESMALVQDCRELEAKLDAWLEELNEEIPTPHYWAQFSDIANPIDDRENRKIFPISFHFPNIYVAKVLMDYWALSIIAYSISFLIHESFAGADRSNRPEHSADDQRAPARVDTPMGNALPPPAIAQKPGLTKTLADNIAQSMEYCLCQDMGMLGPQWTLFALPVALRRYRRFPDSIELEWLLAIHGRICDEKGLKFSRTLVSNKWTNASSNSEGQSHLEAGLNRITGPQDAFGTRVVAESASFDRPASNRSPPST